MFKREHNTVEDFCTKYALTCNVWLGIMNKSVLKYLGWGRYYVNYVNNMLTQMHCNFYLTNKEIETQSGVTAGNVQSSPKQ